MAETNSTLTERHIEAIEKALRRGSRVEVCQSKEEIRIYEITYKMMRMNNA